MSGTLPIRILVSNCHQMSMLLEWREKMEAYKNSLMDSPRESPPPSTKRQKGCPSNAAPLISSETSDIHALMSSSGPFALARSVMASRS